MIDRAHRIAVVGIDGTGKSTLIRRFLEVSDLDSSEVAALCCPSYHETPGASRAELSRQLEAFGRVADRLADYTLKAAALFLQMTLFGPVEKVLIESFRPRVLLCERHALVDSLAYGPFYQKMVGEEVDPGGVGARFCDELEAERSGSFAGVEAWVGELGGRLGLNLTPWNVALYARDLFAGAPEGVVDSLGSWYRTGLPETVVLLDLEVDIAMERLARRGAGEGELHESPETLAFLRERYHQVAANLEQSGRCRVLVVDAGAFSSIDESLQRVLSHVGI